MAALTVVFDLDGTLVDTAPDLIDTLNVVFAREGLPPVDYATARNMIGGGARRMIESGLQARRPRRRPAATSIGCSPISSRTTPPISPTARGRFPGLDARARPPGRARLPLRGLHQQARRAVAAAARRARPDPALCRDLRPGHVRDPEARPRNPAADHRGGRRRACGGRSWSGIPAPISRPRAPPAFRSWRSISATARRRCKELGPDRLISHFDDLAAAVLELAPSCAGEPAGRPNVPQNATLSLNLL